MPVHSFLKLDSDTFLLHWQISESIQDLHQHIPTQCLDYAYLSKISSKQRLRESLAARAALYTLLKVLDLPPFRLGKEHRLAPVLSPRGYHVGFSHTKYLATVALSTKSRIGVDTEYIRPALYHVSHRVLVREELQRSGRCSKALAIHWCAKEALYKLLCPEFPTSFKQITVQPFQPSEHGTLVAKFNGQNYTIHYGQISDHHHIPHINAICQEPIIDQPAIMAKPFGLQ